MTSGQWAEVKKIDVTACMIFKGALILMCDSVHRVWIHVYFWWMPWRIFMHPN